MPAVELPGRVPLRSSFCGPTRIQALECAVRNVATLADVCSPAIVSGPVHEMLISVTKS
jgi:hypothetical protein